MKKAVTEDEGATSGGDERRGEGEEMKGKGEVPDALLQHGAIKTKLSPSPHPHPPPHSRRE